MKYNRWGIASEPLGASIDRQLEHLKGALKLLQEAPKLTEAELLTLPPALADWLRKVYLPYPARSDDEDSNTDSVALAMQLMDRYPGLTLEEAHARIIERAEG